MHILIHFEFKNLMGGDDLFMNCFHESFLDEGAAEANTDTG